MRYDAIIIGGSFAGLTAAMMLARARRPILVIDAGAPRNRFASHSHGVLAQDGRSGGEILADARAQLAAYPTVTMLQGTVVEATGQDGAFSVRTEDGTVAEGRKLLLATGVADTLPDIPGLRERWGKTVLHCPYCHGYEIGGGSIGVLATLPTSARLAGIVADWGDVTFFANGGPQPDDEERAMLERRKVRIEAAPVAAVEGPGTEMEGIRLEDGRLVPVRALFVPSFMRMASPLAEALGCAFDETPAGTLIRTDTMKLTTVPGVYAAGDAAYGPGNITLASADGVRAGMGLHHALIADD
jgi:thioredoxin reductase